MANRVNPARVEAANRVRAAAAKAGRTYEEQLEFEQKNGTLAVRRIGDATSFGAQQAAAPAARPPLAGPQPDSNPPLTRSAGAAGRRTSDFVFAGLVGTGGGGLTALVFAAREGDLESAKLLLDARRRRQSDHRIRLDAAADGDQQPPLQARASS